MTKLRTVYLLGGPRDGTRTLAGGVLEKVGLSDLVYQATIEGCDSAGDSWAYEILGPMQNGELLAVEV